MYLHCYLEVLPGSTVAMLRLTSLLAPIVVRKRESKQKPKWVLNKAAAPTYHSPSEADVVTRNQYNYLGVNILINVCEKMPP